MIIQWTATPLLRNRRPILPITDLTSLPGFAIPNTYPIYTYLPNRPDTIFFFLLLFFSYCFRFFVTELYTAVVGMPVLTKPFKWPDPACVPTRMADTTTTTTTTTTVASKTVPRSWTGFVRVSEKNRNLYYNQLGITANFSNFNSVS